MERRKQHLNSSVKALQGEWNNLQATMTALVKKSKELAEEIDKFDELSFLRNAPDFLHLVQNVHALTQKIMALNLDLETTVLDNDDGSLENVSTSLTSLTNRNVPDERKFSQTAPNVLPREPEVSVNADSCQDVSVDSKLELRSADTKDVSINEGPKSQGEPDFKVCKNKIDSPKQDIRLQSELKTRKKIICENKYLDIRPLKRTSSTSSKESNKTKPFINKEIPESPVPKRNDLCVITSIVNPQEFYITMATETSKHLDSLQDELNVYHELKCRYTSKEEARKKISKYCIAYSSYWSSSYRAEVIDWLDASSDCIKVQFVDYGNYAVVPVSDIRNIPARLLNVPRFAIRCRLAHLYPPGSSDLNILNTWPQSSIKTFEDLTGKVDEKIYYLTYLENDRSCLSIDLVWTEEEDQEEKSLGEKLIEMEAATEILYEPKKIVKNSFMAEQVKTAQGLGSTFDDLIPENAFDNMSIEESENINEAITCYDAQDEARLCRFAKADGTCFKGRNCKLEHGQLRKDGYTSDTHVVYRDSLTLYEFPKVGDIICVTIACVSTIHCFYVQIKDNSEDYALLQLTKELNRRAVSLKRFKLIPACGEIVLAKATDGLWYRAMVTEVNTNYRVNDLVIQVFFVDYGDTTNILLSDVREITEEYLRLPFQAIRCCLSNIVPKHNINPVKAKEFFESKFLTQKLQCLVNSNEIDSGLGVQLFDIEGQDVGKVLVEKGFANSKNDDK